MKHSQNPVEARQFDFWVGHWACSGDSYDAAGNTTHTDGENTITRTFDDHVYQEDFRSGTTRGMSVSVYNPTAKIWRQTWVDNEGGYIPLKGGMQGDEMVLTLATAAPQPKAFNRMVFTNIKPDSFDWRWEATADGGKTWKPSWLLHYTRKKA